MRCHRQQLAQLNEERRIAELARKEREALMAAPPAPSSPKQQQQPSHGDVGGWDDHNGGSRSLDDLPTMPGTQVGSCAPAAGQILGRQCGGV